MQRSATADVKKYFKTISVVAAKDNRINDPVGSAKTPSAVHHRQLSVTIADAADVLHKSNMSDA